MSGYLLSVIGVVLFSSLLLAALPNGKTGEVIRGVARIACIVAILSPVVYFFVDSGDMGSFFDESGIETGASFIQYCSEERIKAAEKQLQTELSELYEGIRSVKIFWEAAEIRYGEYSADGIKVLRIVVYADKMPTVSTTTKIIEYLFTKYGCEGEVVSLDGMA